MRPLRRLFFAFYYTRKRREAGEEYRSNGSISLRTNVPAPPERMLDSPRFSVVFF